MHVPSITFDIDGEFINLQQDDGCGMIHCAILHRIHLEYIAGQLGVPVLTGTAAELARRLSALRDRVKRLADDTFFRNELIERTGEGFEYLARIDAIADLAVQFCTDIGGAVTEIQVPRNQNAAAVSVTPQESPKRGRPPTGEAMTNAERQAKHRQKQSRFGASG